MAKHSWYGWRDAKGNGGVCKTWEECERASSGNKGDSHKGFKTYEEAWAFAHPDQPVQTAPAAAAPETDSWEEPPWDVDDFREGKTDPNPAETDKDAGRTEDSDAAPDRAVKLDCTRAEKTPISEAVNQFCDQFQFSHLSEDQRRALQAAQGKYLLFAVPGSGKTTVLTARTGYLIYGCHIRPDSLMTMTFTRASAKEMRKRYCDYFHPNEDQIPDFRTIHSFCYSIVIPMLRRAGFRCPFHIVNEDHEDQARKKRYAQHVILKNVLKKYLGTGKASDETAQETVQTAFSSIKNREMTEEEYSCFSVKIDKAKYPLAPLFQDYQETLLRLDCMDFDDMLVYALKGLKEKPDVLKALQNRYRYWSIDEAQDNSKIQHELMNLLAGEKGNLFMVGDDDQSIYGFRGSEPNMLLAFGNRPDVRLLMMGTNYRSDYSIVRAAKPFVELNLSRADKHMNASHTEPGEINIPLSFSTEARQYEFIVNAARESYRTRTKLGILYQLNVSALPLIVYMHRAGIPFEASKGLGELLHKKTTGNIFRILSLSQHPCSLEKLQESRKSLGLHWLTDEMMKQLKTVHQSSRQKPLLQIILDSFEEENERSRMVSRILEVLRSIRDVRPSEAVITLLKSPDLAPPAETLTDRLSVYALLSICDLYDSVPEMLKSLADMEKAEKRKENDTPEEGMTEEDGAVMTSGETCITLSTIHSAKGREWDRVLLIDSFQETFPGEPQFDRIGYDPEEARRVFYVAVTRAVHRLDILTVGLWHGNGERISGFIPEFAWMAEQNGEGYISEKNEEDGTGLRSSEYVFSPNLYYGVPVGRKPGVYTDYKKVEEQVKGFSIPAGKHQKKFFSFEDAWEYTFPGQPVPEPEKPLRTDSIRKIIQLSGGPTFNKAIDMPRTVRNSIYEHFGVNALQELSRERIARLRAECDLFNKGAPADYHGHTDGYTVAYMPVNFYKIWLPLWNLLEDKRLPHHVRILEIGPGPGTATWSFVEFYRLLALDNPGEQFDIQYTAVERETEFQGIFHLIQDQLQRSLPANLRARIQLIAGTDAFDYLVRRNLTDLDMILESNVFNEAENMDRQKTQNYLTGLRQKLKEKGTAILIEPGTNDMIRYLQSVARAAQEGYECSTYREAVKSAVYLEDNTLVREAQRTGIRYKQKMEHWFSYMILERNGGAI